MKKSHRVGAICQILTESPEKIFTLSYFCDKFSAAKSSISEDISAAKEAVKATGYGYIEVKDDEIELNSICKVKRFREKPSQELAESYLASGKYLWNSGIFIRAFKGRKPHFRRWLSIYFRYNV